MMGRGVVKRLRSVLREKKGFTLTELLVVLVLLVLIFFMAYQFFDFSGIFFKKIDDTAAKQQQARVMTAGMKKDFGTALEAAVVSDRTALTIPAGKFAVYIDDGRLAKEDSSGTVSYIYSSSRIDTLEMQVEAADTSIMHITILSGGEVLAETDIYCQNASIGTDTAAGFDTSGDTVLYVPTN